MTAFDFYVEVARRGKTCSAMLRKAATICSGDELGSVSSAGITSARCSVTYTPTSRGAGSHTITADYGGDLAGQGHGAHLLSAGSSEPVRIGLRSASIVAKCLPVYVPLRKPATCKATVTDSSGSASAITPSGTVSFALEPLWSGQKVKGTFSGGGQCTLQGSGASAACSVSYTPTAVGGLHEIVVVYNGDQAHLGGPDASRNVSFVIATAAVGAPPGRCGGVAVTILGSARADRLAGTHRRDAIATGSGVDRISAGGGSDLVCAGAGNDRIFGGPGNDRIFGGPGNDRITPGPGRDHIDAGAGNDRVFSRDGRRDVIDCGPGHDVAIVDAIDRTRRCEVVSRPRRRA